MTSPSDAEEDVVLRIRRCRDPQSEPTVQEVRVPRRHGWSVLDALQHVKDRIDPTLSFRGSCRMGICGSCGLEVDGTPVLACGTFVRDARGPLDVAPLRHFPVERDLIVALGDPLDSLVRLRTWLAPADRPGPDAPPRRQTPDQLRVYKDHAMCIGCMLCYSACPQYGLDDFLGPAALALAQRYNLDSRDAGSAARLERAGAEDGVWRCTVVGTCSEVCPAGVRPATAIQQLKLAAAGHAVRTLAPAAAGETTVDAPRTEPARDAAEARSMSRLWWTSQPSYRRYMLRESSALFVALHAAFLLYLAVVLRAEGPVEAHVEHATAILTTPGALLLHAVALPFIAFHAFTWLRIAPMLLRTRRPGRWTVVLLGLPLLALAGVLGGLLS
jgi:succinate dehydrogenase/fumarate reductase iron-sulfur protein